MKLSYHDQEGNVFTGLNANRVVIAMRRAAWKAPGKSAYMEEVARRVIHLSKGRWHIPTGSADEFLSGLVTAGLLVKR